MPLADLPSRLAEFDVVVSCTASSLPIIGLGAVERALKLRRHRPMFMVDLAVPRDIEPEVARLSDVYLYTVDDLSALVQTAGERRQAAVAQAEAIIETGVQSFVQWLDQRGSVPLIQALHVAGRRLALARDRTRQEAARRWRRRRSAVLDALSKGLTQKMLHGTLAELQRRRRRRSARSSRIRCRACSCAPARAGPTTASVSDARAGRHAWPSRLRASLPLVTFVAFVIAPE